MIQHLFKNRYPSAYGLNPSTINVPWETYTTSFSISDRLACTRCHSIREDRKDCNEEILRIDPNEKTILLLNFESYIQQFTKVIPNLRDKCDYFLYSETEKERKIAFCDLTCSDIKWVKANSGKYPEGKKAKARQQMSKSIEYLVADPLIGEFIYTCSKKLFIFGWRDYNAPLEAIKPQKNSFSTNLQAFMTTPSGMAKQLTSKVALKKETFDVVTVKYPSVYQW